MCLVNFKGVFFMPIPEIEPVVVEKWGNLTIIDSVTQEEYLNITGPIGSGSYAKIYHALRKSKSTSGKLKEKAVRIVVTQDRSTFSREKNPSEVFRKLKEEFNELKDTKFMSAFRNEDDDTWALKPDYYKYLSIPKLRHQFAFYKKSEWEANDKKFVGLKPIGYMLVFDYDFEDGDIFTKIKEIAENKSAHSVKSVDDKEVFDAHQFIKNYARSVLNAIAKLHSLKKIHNDIKPGNILCSQNKSTGEFTFKLTDYGLMCEHRTFKTYCEGEIRKTYDDLSLLNKYNKKAFKEKAKELTKRIQTSFNEFTRRCSQDTRYMSPEKSETYTLLVNFKKDVESQFGELKKGRVNFWLDWLGRKYFPEYNNIVDHINHISYPTDIYSFGQTLQVISSFIINFEPQKQISVADMNKAAITNAPSTFFSPRSGNKEDQLLKKFINCLTDPNPDKRPKAIEALKDNYLK